MIRKLAVSVLVLAVVTIGALWLITIPATLAADDLPPHTPNLTNGKEMFFAGGCASCHAVPKQRIIRSLAAGLRCARRSALSMFRNFARTGKMASARGRETQFVTAVTKGNSPEGASPLSGLSVHVLSTHAHRRRARPVCLHQDIAPGSGRARDHDLPFPFNIRRRRNSGNCCFWTASRSSRTQRNRRNGIAARIWSNGAGHCAECHRRATYLGAPSSRQAFYRRSEPGRAGRRSRHHPNQAQGLDRAGHRRERSRVE